VSATSGRRIQDDERRLDRGELRAGARPGNRRAVPHGAGGRGSLHDRGANDRRRHEWRPGRQPIGFGDRAHQALPVHIVGRTDCADLASQESIRQRIAKGRTLARLELARAPAGAQHGVPLDGEVAFGGVVEAALGVRGDERQATQLVECIKGDAEPRSYSVHRFLRQQTYLTELEMRLRELDLLPQVRRAPVLLRPCLADRRTTRTFALAELEQTKQPLQHRVA
jgi:hypothetical protein